MTLIHFKEVDSRIFKVVDFVKNVEVGEEGLQNVEVLNVSIDILFIFSKAIRETIKRNLYKIGIDSDTVQEENKVRFQAVIQEEAIIVWEVVLLWCKEVF